jgi:hypothetical protein
MSRFSASGTTSIFMRKLIFYTKTQGERDHHKALRVRQLLPSSDTKVQGTLRAFGPRRHEALRVRQLLPRAPTVVMKFTHVAMHYPHSCPGILTWFPFDRHEFSYLFLPLCQDKVQEKILEYLNISGDGHNRSSTIATTQKTHLWINCIRAQIKKICTIAENRNSGKQSWNIAQRLEACTSQKIRILIKRGRRKPYCFAIEISAALVQQLTEPVE